MEIRERLMEPDELALWEYQSARVGRILKHGVKLLHAGAKWSLEMMDERLMARHLLTAEQDLDLVRFDAVLCDSHKLQWKSK